MARSVSIRTSLLASMGVLILVLAVVVVAITAFTGNQLVEVASRRLIDRALDRSESELGAFFSPIVHNLEMVRGWIESGALDLEDDAELQAFFGAMMESYTQISAVHTGDAEGRGWILIRRDDGWYSRRVDPVAFGDRILHRVWADDGRVVREWWVDDPEPGERYDPRSRDWYRTTVDGAARFEPDVVRPSRVYWTEPYVFFTDPEPGLTGTVHVDAPDGRILLAFDVLLRDVSDFTRSIEITPNGFVGMLSRDRRLVGVPRHPAFDSPHAVRAALLERPGDLGVEIFDDAIAARLRAGLPELPAPGTDGFFSFSSGGERYWSGVRAVPVPPDHHYLVVVNVPERDLLGPIRRLRTGVTFAAALALLASVVSVWWLARSYSRPLATLARASARIRRLDLQEAAPVRSVITEIAQLAGAQERMRVALDAFSRYVPTDVVRELVELGEAAKIGGERKMLSVMFSDIEGFTGISERKSPEELTHHLAGYFDELLPIFEEIGTVDKLVGDGIMAFWGAPLPDPHHARHAVEAVSACRLRLEALNVRWRGEGEPPLPTRFGLATGPALVGNVGSRRRLSYTAVGDVVNLASRLEGLNRWYGTTVLAAEPIPALAGGRFVWREVDRVRVVGRSQAVAIYELLGVSGSVDAQTLAFARGYARALALHRRRAWDEAMAELDGLAEPWRGNASVVRLRAIAAALRESPPPADWEAVTPLEHK